MNPWDTLTDREKDALLAEKVVGLRVWREPPFADEPVLVNETDEIVGVPALFTTDRNAFAEVEAALERRGVDVCNRYVAEVMRAVTRIENDESIMSYFALITAPLGVRCRAAIRAVGVEV